MALPTPQPIATPPAPATPPASVTPPAPAVLGAELGAPAPDSVGNVANITQKLEGENTIAKRFYQYTGREVTPTPNTVEGAVTYIRLGLVEIDLTNTGLDKVRLYIEGTYREVPNGAKLIVNRDDLARLVVKPFIKQLDDSKVKLSIG